MSKDLLELKQYTFSGTLKAMGHAHGETLKNEIQELIETRFLAAEIYFRLNRVSSFSNIQSLKDTGKSCLAILEKWDPDGFTENNAIASAANVDPVDLYTATNYTDIRDALMLSKTPDEEGCSAFLIPHNRTEEGNLLAGQTWDLNPQDIKFVVAINNRPNKGPERWSVLVAGSLGLMGMNSAGICTGTTNLKTWHSRAGLGYLSLIYRTLRSETLQEAESFIEKAPKAGAHSYWIIQQNNGVHYEVTSIDSNKTPLQNQPLGWTNHCLVPEYQKYEYEPPSESSLTRYKRMQSIFQSQKLFSVEDIRTQIMCNRQDGINSIDRYPIDTKSTATNACVIADSVNKKLHTCRGPADLGKWYTLSFS